MIPFHLLPLLVVFPGGGNRAGGDHHPLWRNISANWVALHGNPQTVSLYLETIWNSTASTPEGYRAVGAALAAAVREYLAGCPERP